jgi:thiol-disulfide isomerase/thioredoxin
LEIAFKRIGNWNSNCRVAGIFIFVWQSAKLPAMELSQFELTDTEGKIIDQQNLNGKVVVVNIWATWCGPCIKEMHAIQKLWFGMKEDSNIVFIVASDEPVERIKKFREKKGYQIPFYHFSLKENTPPIKGRPASYIFDKKKEIIYSRLETLEWTSNSFFEKLKSYMNK